MYERFRSFLLRWLKVPHEPEPPFGRPDSVRIFRAGRNYIRLRLLGWGVGQVFAVLGLIFWLGVLWAAENQVRQQQGDEASRPAWTTKRGPARDMARLIAKAPAWVFPLLWVLKGLTILAYLAQVFVTYAVLRLDYEMRWYMVTDRSLRIRSGVWSVQEMTMSFANLQQVEVSQGPVQRLLGLADVRVQSAGGGGGGGHPHGQQPSMHMGHFHGVVNADEIRDLILERLRKFREAGLGDPDEKVHEIAPLPVDGAVMAAEIRRAAAELVAEARALRAAL
jgi:hypothetical protein